MDLYLLNFIYHNFFQKKLPIIKSPHLVDISSSQIEDITADDYYNLFEDNSNPNFNEMIKKLLNNTSTIIYKDNDTIKKTRINGNTLLANYIIENINYVKDNTCLVTKEIYIFYNWILRNSEGKPIKRYNKSKYKKDHKKDHDDYTFLS